MGRRELIHLRETVRIRAGEEQRFRDQVEKTLKASKLDEAGLWSKLRDYAEQTPERRKRSKQLVRVETLYERLHALTNPKKKLRRRVAERTFELLKALAPDQPWADMVISRQDEPMYESYLTWKRTMWTRAVRAVSIFWRRDRNHNPKPFVSGPDHQFDRLGELKRFRLKATAKFPHLFKPLDDLARRRGHAQDRIDLAYCRILEPLLDAYESGFIERPWDDMTNAERNQFLAGGVAREMVMLDRPAENPEVVAKRRAKQTDEIATGRVAQAAARETTRLENQHRRDGWIEGGRR